MRRRTADTVITAALSDLDSAPEAALDEVERARADAAFARIVATPSDDTAREAPGRPSRRRGLLVAAGLTGAVGVAVPVLLAGGSAYGSWTEMPEALTRSAADEAAGTCRANLASADGGERVALAERRGGWTYVLLAGPGAEAICLMPNDLVGQGARDRGDFFGSYDADAPAPPILTPDGLDQNTSMQGSTDEGWFFWTEGYVGSDVAGVTVHTSPGLDIEASVVGGRYAVWWPAAQQGSGNPDETWTYTVHLADGTTRTVDPSP